MFDSSSSDTQVTAAVSLQADNWMNAKSDKSNSYHKLCEMSKYNYVLQKALEIIIIRGLTFQRRRDILLCHKLNKMHHGNQIYVS